MAESAKANRLDINQMMALAESDPEQFEVMRTEAIESFIQNASEKHRNHLRRVQWRVDRVRERAANPMAATIAISEMMWDSFYELHDRYQELLGNISGKGRQDKLARTKNAARPAEVIPFPAPVDA